MIGVLVAGFLIAHGLLHPGVWSARLPTGTRTPIDAGQSWAFTAARVSAPPTRAVARALAWYIATPGTAQFSRTEPGSTPPPILTHHVVAVLVRRSYRCALPLSRSPFSSATAFSNSSSSSGSTAIPAA